MNGWIVQFSGHQADHEDVDTKLYNLLHVTTGEAEWMAQVRGEKLARRIAELLNLHGTEGVDMAAFEGIKP